MTIFDACIIGAGPAGLTVAMELADQGMNVIVVESGTEADNPSAQRLSDAEILTPASHEVMEDSVKRGLGGTSALWGGRCVPLDAIDFEKRDGIEGSGWPLSAADLEPYYLKACAILGVGEPAFEISTCNSSPTQDSLLTSNFKDTQVILGSQLERWSQSPNLWSTFKEVIKSHTNITIQSGYTCIGFRQEKLDSSVNEILLKNTNADNSEPIIIKSRFFVIACGGVESTRLVLNSINDPLGLKLASPQLVGRYYMGHPSGKIADILLCGDPKETIYGFESDNGVYIRRRITLQANTLRKEKLLNIAFWFDNSPIADWQHGSGILSAAYLALTTPLIGRLLAPAAIRKRMAGGYKVQRLRHLLNCLGSPLSTLVFCIKFIWQRYIAKPRIPGFFTFSANNSYTLHYHAEQAPNWDSTITLSDEDDALGLKRAKISLKWSHQDIESIIKAHQILDKELQSNSIGRLVYRVPTEQLFDSIYDQAVDGFHQIGTLRMSNDAKSGVTDCNGLLWGTQNVFIASSAIFPTSGQANPTLTMLALVIKQAQYISEIFHRESNNA